MRWLFVSNLDIYSDVLLEEVIKSDDVHTRRACSSSFSITLGFIEVIHSAEV